MKALRVATKKYSLYLPFIKSGQGRDFIVHMTREHHYPDLSRSKVKVVDLEPGSFEFGLIYWRD